MYFTSRAEAGKKLAEEIKVDSPADTIVVALNTGAVEVAEQIASSLRCRMALLLSEDIELPGEQSTIGTVSQSGDFTYNSSLSSGEVDEYYSELHGYIDDQKREQFAKINRLLGEGGFVERESLRNHTTIIVSDGFKNTSLLDAAELFLKPVKIKHLIIATPVASVQAVDRMHIFGDELHCLNVTDNYIDTNHYYDNNTVLSHDEILTKIKITTDSASQDLSDAPAKL
ncbi:MAG TPA: hypothetical protein VNG90_03920 [Candidatus Acidoferrum sp.]|nr:hypothetical protein [Candidatus Acidoferrum sp.]